jgi:hypothetical protein
VLGREGINHHSDLEREKNLNKMKIKSLHQIIFQTVRKVGLLENWRNEINHPSFLFIHFPVNLNLDLKGYKNLKLNFKPHAYLPVFQQPVFF